MNKILTFLRRAWRHLLTLLGLGPKQRTDLLMGYFGGCDSCANETKDHTNIYMTRPWGPGGDGWITEVIPQLQQALSNGQRVVLGLPGAYDSDAEAQMRLAFQAFKSAGVVANIMALYPIDEPDKNGKTDSEVTATNAMLRHVMSDIGMSASLAVIYDCVSSSKPGIASYDWIGCDDYGSGCDVADGSRYAALKAQLTSSQHLMLIPGGADPWKQDPQCFLDAANWDSQIIAIMPFLWVDYELPGIRANGMRDSYVRVGKIIKGTA